MDEIKILLDTSVADLAVKVAAMDDLTDNIYEAAAAAMPEEPELSDALYAAANEMHKSTEAMRNVVSIFETASEKRW